MYVIISDDSILTEGVTCTSSLNIYLIVGITLGAITVVFIAITCVVLKFCCIPRIIQPEPPASGK